MNKLLAQLKGVHNRKAHFKTVLALILDEKEYLFEGIVHGVIAHEKKELKVLAMTLFLFLMVIRKLLPS